MVAPIQAGSLIHRITLENPAAPVGDTDGGYAEAWSALTPGTVYASIESASTGKMERLANGTVTSAATHIVTMRHHPDVTTKTRISFGTRVFQIVGVMNVDEMDVMTRAFCTEVVA